MGTDSIRVSGVVPASAQRVYEAWLDSEKHAAMTGSTAAIEGRVGGRHSAWDGYIEGETLELDPGRRIVQSWRSQEFPPDAAHSRLEVLLEPEHDGARITFIHTEIPEGQGPQYERGWDSFYLVPMRRYFAQVRTDAVSPEVSREEESASAMAPAPTAAKAAAKKSAKKKSAKKKAAKKPAKKAPAKKPAKKAPAKKPAKKAPAKKASKKKASKAAPKAPKKSAKKPAKAKKSAKKAPAKKR
jgi:uncharacterized protein YndB with AHSA1/START domain